MALPTDRLGRWLDRVAAHTPTFIDVYKGFAALVAGSVMLGGFALMRRSPVVGSGVVISSVAVAVLIVRRYEPGKRR